MYKKEIVIAVKNFLSTEWQILDSDTATYSRPKIDQFIELLEKAATK